MAHRKITNETRRAVVAEFWRGDPVREISRRHGVHEQTIRAAYRAEYPEERLSMIQRRVRARLDEVRQWRADGMSVQDIATRLGTDDVSAARALQSFGIDTTRIILRGPRAPHGSPARWQDGCRCEVCEPARQAYKRAEREKAQAAHLDSNGIADGGHGRAAASLGCQCEICQEARITYQRERQAATLRAARRHQRPWTGPEVELVARRDPTIQQIAEMTGRTYAAVSNVRAALADPERASHHRYMSLLVGQDQVATGTHTG